MEISQEDFERAIEVVYMRGVVRDSSFVPDGEINDIIADVYDLLKYDINAAQPEICGLCGEPGADKYAHPQHWPGEQIPDTEFVHAACEDEECKRAHAALSSQQREAFLRTIR